MTISSSNNDITFFTINNIRIWIIIRKSLVRLPFSNGNFISNTNVVWFCIISFVSIIFYFLFFLSVLFTYIFIFSVDFVIYKVMNSSFKPSVKIISTADFSCSSMGSSSVISQKFIKLFLPVLYLTFAVCKTLLIMLLKFSTKPFAWGYAGAMR